MSQLTDLFNNIANAIRAKTGNSAAIAAAEFPQAIAGIEAPAPVYVQGYISSPKNYTLQREITIPALIGKKNAIIQGYSGGYSGGITSKCLIYLDGYSQQITKLGQIWISLRQGTNGDLYTTEKTNAISWNPETGTMTISPEQDEVAFYPNSSIQYLGW